MHAHVGAARDAVMLQEVARESGGSLRVFAVHLKVTGPRRGQEHRRRRGRGADPAKPSPTRSTEIEDTEMQTGACLDTNAAALAAGFRANQESLLTGSSLMTEVCVRITISDYSQRGSE